MGRGRTDAVVMIDDEGLSPVGAVLILNKLVGRRWNKFGEKLFVPGLCGLLLRAIGQFILFFSGNLVSVGNVFCRYSHGDVKIGVLF